MPLIPHQSSLKPEEEKILKKISDLLNKNQEVHIFDEKEVETIKDMMEVYKTILAFGTIGRIFKNILLGLAATLGAYYVIYESGANIMSKIAGWFIK